MSEERIEPGDRVVTGLGRVGIVTALGDGDADTVFVSYIGPDGSWWLPGSLRLVAKARYEPVPEPEAAEDPVVAVRAAFEDRYAATLERIAEAPDWWPDSAPVARAVLALIEDRNAWKMKAELADVACEAEISRWRSATGCDTPEEAQQRIEVLQDRGDAGWTEAGAATDESIRLRGELDEARAQTATAWRERGEREHNRACAAHNRMLEQAEAEVARLTARAEAAEHRLSELRGDLANLLSLTSPSVVSDETEAGVRDTTAKEGP